jgi:uncharacterized RDD family membrane protein YckC
MTAHGGDDRREWCVASSQLSQYRLAPAILSSMQPQSASSASLSSAIAFSAEPAHLGWRLLAMLYDLFPLMALWFATSVLVYLAHGLVPVRPYSVGAWIELALLWTVTGAYLVISWRRGGATIGMRPWRLKVLADDGHPAALRSLCLRYLVATLSVLALGIGVLWSVFDGERRCWHDQAAGTRFVRLDRIA